MKRLIILLCLVFALTGCTGGERMTGTGTPADPYVITTRADLAAVNDHLDAYYELGADINLAASNWTPIGWAATYDTDGAYTSFTGNFDGKGHKISNMHIVRDLNTVMSADNCGLFCYVDVDGIVKNLTLCGASISITLKSDGLYNPICVGLMVGDLSDGTAEDCVASGSITITGTKTGSVPSYIGGFCGENYRGVATRCRAYATISSANQALDCVGVFTGQIDWGGTNTDCSAKGTITAPGDYHGGFAGYGSNGSATRCAASADVSGTGNYYGGFLGSGNLSTVTMTDCFAVGDVTGADYIGGFAGGGNRCTYVRCFSIGVVLCSGANVGGFCGQTAYSLTSSYWDTESSGKSSDPSATGKTTAQMQTQGTFTGWDFSTVWNIASGTYPFVRTASVTITDGCAAVSIVHSFPWVGRFQMCKVTV